MPDAKPVRNATFRVPEDVLRRARERAVAEDRRLNDVVVEVLAAYGGKEDAQGSRLLADADRFLKRRGPNSRARRFTLDELHESDEDRGA